MRERRHRDARLYLSNSSDHSQASCSTFESEVCDAISRTQWIAGIGKDGSDEQHQKMMYYVVVHEHIFLFSR